MQLPMLLTPYSIYTLGSNGVFSYEKAARELGYAPRPVEETLADIVPVAYIKMKCRFIAGVRTRTFFWMKLLSH